MARSSRASRSFTLTATIAQASASADRLRGRARSQHSRLEGAKLVKAFALAAATLFAIVLSGCAGRPSGNLLVVSGAAPGAASVDMLVATTCSDKNVPPAIMFNGGRGIGLLAYRFRFSRTPCGTPAKVRGRPASR